MRSPARWLVREKYRARAHVIYVNLQCDARNDHSQKNPIQPRLQCSNRTTRRAAAFSFFVFHLMHPICMRTHFLTMVAAREENTTPQKIFLNAKRTITQINVRSTLHIFFTLFADCHGAAARLFFSSAFSLHV